jgi:glycogen debranching enzyme
VVIGFQDGTFPDLGRHRFGEMGGVWTHPLKIADGFWIGIEPDDVGSRSYFPHMRNWLTRCDEFVLGDGGSWVEHRYKRRYEEMTTRLENPPAPPSDEPADLFIIRRQFTPKDEPALGVEVTLESLTGAERALELSILVRFDMLANFFSGWPDPLRLEAETGNGMVYVHSVRAESLPFTGGRWTAVLASDLPADRIVTGEDLWGPEKTQGRGISVMLKFRLKLNPRARVRFVLAGDCEGEGGAVEACKRVLHDFDTSQQKKIGWYRSIAQDMTTLETPEKLMNEAFLWSKLNLEWLTVTSPYMTHRVGDEWLIFRSPYVGTGVVAGYADYAFYFGGDTAVSIMGMLAAGLHDTAKQSLRMLGAIAKKQNGRVPHNVPTNGAVYDHGYVGETPLFVRAVWDTYLWTGDEGFLKEMYPICKMCILDYLFSQPRQDGILLLDTGDNPDSPRDKGNPSFVIPGVDAMWRLAERVGDVETGRRCRSEAELMKRQLEELFWVEEQNLYTGSLDRNNKPVSDEKNQFWSYMHTTLELAYGKAADANRMAKALSRIEGKPYSSAWGIYLAPGACIMPYTAGKAAVGEFNYGRVDQGMRYVRTIARTMGHIMPGGFPETVDASGDPKKSYPGWPFVQLWSASHVAHGLVWGLLGIEPDAAGRTVRLKPRLPAGWTTAEFRDLTIGQSKIGMRIERGKAEIIQADGPKLKIDIL